ncbi:MAG: type I glyceraldehyde-3-phosphate dehydrogenase, partial [Fimbriimonadaceae bacterium]|nr:type I glyceraldehyde-3-phosphate dehydrogenase [Fimbriimonadaceae bacterium]
MPVRVGINGFGRIGRLSLRTIIERHGGDIEVVALNDLTDVGTNAYLFQYDTCYGNFDGQVTHDEDSIQVGGYDVKVFKEPDPANIDWNSVGCDIVIESTGRFTDANAAKAHLGGSVKKVIISAPGKNEDVTLVLGVND